MTALPRTGLILALCGGLAAGALADDRSAETILREYDEQAAAAMPKPVSAEIAKDRNAMRDLSLAMTKARERRDELALELFRTHPDHERVPKLLLVRWGTHPFNPPDPAAMIDEIDRSLPLFKDPKLKTTALFSKACFMMVKDVERPTAALPVIDALIRHDPADSRGPILLDLLAARIKDPAARVLILKRLIAEFPDSRNAVLAQEKVDLIGRLGRPFDLEFDEAITGTHVSIKELRGKVVVLDFWATWCVPCVAEIPKLKELYARYHDRGVEFIGISLDKPKDEGGFDKLAEFVAKNAVAWPQFYQGDGTASEFSSKLGVHSIPQLFLIDAEGNLAEIEARSKLETLIPEYLAKAQAAANRR